MFSAKAELLQKNALQIKQDDKFFCRLLSKESSMSYPSFRVAVAVPFVWESQPGTPKYTFSEDTLPPLTPPPSYYFKTITTACNRKPVKRRPRSNLLLALFPKLNLKKTILSPSSSSPSSFSSPSSLWSSSDNSSKVVPVGKLRSRVGSRGDDEEDGATSPTSTLCFSFPRSTSSNRRR